jgi:hypothetical protein
MNDILVEYKGTTASKLTITAEHEVRVKISDEDKSNEQNILENVRHISNLLHDIHIPVTIRGSFNTSGNISLCVKTPDGKRKEFCFYNSVDKTLTLR